MSVGLMVYLMTQGQYNDLPTKNGGFLRALRFTPSIKNHENIKLIMGIW